LKGELIASDQVYQVIIRFIVGDIAGLIFCMILLVFIFRALDKFTASTH
jgi:hypothetical protein